MSFIKTLQEVGVRHSVEKFNNDVVSLRLDDTDEVVSFTAAEVGDAIAKRAVTPLCEIGYCNDREENMYEVCSISPRDTDLFLLGNVECKKIGWQDILETVEELKLG